MLKKLKLLDKLILKSLTESFFLGVLIFTSLMFASDTFLYIVKQISQYGIPARIAFMIVMLKLPAMMVLTIPMGVLLATIFTVNKLCQNTEFTIIRACGVSLTRISAPILSFGLIAAISTFMINEFVVPSANLQARTLMIWALTQKNIPEGKSNFSFKELTPDHQLKRLYYVDKYEDKTLSGITVLDLSKKDTIQIIQSKTGSLGHDYWKFNNGAMYTISRTGKVMNTTVFDNSKMYTTSAISSKFKDAKPQEFNYFQLSEYINGLKLKNNDKQLNQYLIQLYEKLSMPAVSIVLMLIGIPLAITPPRARYSPGLIFSVLIIFIFYILRAFAYTMGETGVILPVIAAWLPNFIIGSAGLFLFYRKAYLI